MLLKPRPLVPGLWTLDSRLSTLDSGHPTYPTIRTDRRLKIGATGTDNLSYRATGRYGPLRNAALRRAAKRRIHE